MNVMMQCGCRANAFTSDGKPVCLVHYGLAEALLPMATPPELAGRTAICGDCGRLRPSSVDLPFFASHPGLEHDTFYCGCRGWE